MAKGEIVFIFASAFLFGVFFRGLEWSIYFLLGFLALILFARPVKPIIMIGVLLFSVGGFIYYQFSLDWKDVSFSAPLNQSINFSGVVSSEPRLTDNAQIFQFRLLDERGALKIVASKERLYEYGDKLELKGRIVRSENEYELISFYPGAQIVGKGFGNPLKSFLLGIKESSVAVFKRNLPGQSSALVSGLVFGDTNDFSSDFKDKLSRSGTTHLVALSGYNISLIVSAFGFLLFNFLSRRKVFFFTIVGIVLFVLMTGGEASIIRASVMGFLVLLARESARPYSFKNAIVLAASVMVALSPPILVSDIGFQLSFLSVVGVVYHSPLLKRFLDKRISWDPLNWKENLSLTISSQLLVMPVLLLYFNQFSLSGIAANILILCLVPITMFLGFTTALLGMIIPFSAGIVAPFLNILLEYELAVVDFFSRSEMYMFKSSITPYFLFVYYLCTFCLTVYYYKRKGFVFNET